MKIYLVGGAVRDEILNIPVKEKDYVVVGATVAEMTRRGFRQVGKDFPVFLHPETNEEYALARVERKTGPGYTGFSFDTSPNVTLEEDLKRRDLTINAIAKDLETNQRFDPFHGEMDLDKKILRHVSEAFVEDPVRILRVARFAARFPDFTVADETVSLMQEMVKSGEVNALVPERVWKELEKALSEKHPRKFFDVLSDCNALSVLFPDLNMISVSLLEQVSKSSADSEIRFATLVSHMPIDRIKALCKNYKIPSAYQELALLVATYRTDYFDVVNRNPTQILQLLQSLDAFRREMRFEKFLCACEYTIPRRLFRSSKLLQTRFLEKRFKAAKNIKLNNIVGKTGKEIGELQNRLRLDAIANVPLESKDAGPENDDPFWLKK